MAKRARMASDSSGWPVLEDRPPLGRVRHATPQPRRRTRSRSVWLLPVLAFICGALVSAAVFTIGWRHQTQQNTAAESALVRETARNHTLTASLAAARAAEARDRHVAAEARATARRLVHAGAAVAAAASASTTAAGSLSDGAAGISSAAAKLASELKTLTTYLTTTPTSQLDSGYIQSQAAYLTKQIDGLQGNGASLGSTVSTFDTAARQLGRLAAALAARD
ncbi:MAG TPA: hypothetical protein VFA37_07815 [Gaiellaceae bacterium]|nr:hypothetical protein [Gaiellaceae bacterium]